MKIFERNIYDKNIKIKKKNSIYYTKNELSIKKSRFFCLALLFLFMLIVFFPFTNLTIANVEGQSMFPTFNNYSNKELKDRVQFDADAKYFAGDVVILKLPEEINPLEISVIKRVIGKGGDVIEFRFIDGNYELIRNGERIEENYISSKGHNYDVYNNLLRLKTLPEWSVCFDENEPVKFTVPKDSLFILGDNREPLKSRDSREFGFISEKCYRGKVAEIYLPTDNFVVSFSKYIRMQILTFLKGLFFIQ